ncbi:hypothetical protein PsorP6_010090 [Peronosclerospora sorghi]|uniref:Uncharacterized protein n=1 Tax=Peronosclerospora sorghi TaxID=230839 RepID=A0ACC0VZ29_9STRA|nr:hypothetical protein PsorP6_010090 [Peronosclerospora sorghi]
MRGPVEPVAIIVPVDEVHHEEDFETMRMTPVYWPALEEMVVCRSKWVYAQRHYGLSPYTSETATILECAFDCTRLKRLMEIKSKNPRGFFISPASFSEVDMATRVEKDFTLSITVEGHFVEFKGVQAIVQYKRLLAVTTSFTSKCRVYREIRVRVLIPMFAALERCDGIGPNYMKIVEGY